MQRKIRVVQIGLGPIGLRITRYLVERGAFEIAAAIDIDPAKGGRDLGDLAGLPAPLNVRVSRDADTALKRVEAQVAIVTTTSSIEKIEPQVMQVLSHRLHVISTCEELAYPWITHPESAMRIDDAARDHGLAVLATGVNPGFLMDLLPLTLTGVCHRVEAVTVERIQNAEFRRIPFQRKIGAGLSPADFQTRVSEGTLRHVGLTESMHMIASAFGWELERTEELIEPVIAERQVQTKDLTVEPGQVLGVSQLGHGFLDGRKAISLVFRAAIGEAESYERIAIRGTPDIDMTIKGGINGDIATGAVVVNAVPAVVRARPGLRTMADTELISYFR